MSRSDDRHRDPHGFCRDGKGEEAADNGHDVILAELSRPVACPDMTRSIMGRLGYMQVQPTVARRHRIRRLASRAMVLALMLTAIIAAISIKNQSDAVRHPHEVTIPSAIRHDVEQHQQRVNTFIRVLRDSAPRHSSPLGHPASDDAPRMAVPAWQEGAGIEARSAGFELESDASLETVSPDEKDQPDHWPTPETMPEEVDRSAIAPVRWV